MSVVRDDCPRTVSPPECLDDDAVAGFVDGLLASDARGRVERQIDRCATCRRQVSEVIRLRSQIGALATLPASGAPAKIGRYEVRAMIGRGGMGTVWRAWDPQLEREVAIKVVRGETADGALRLMREARALAKLRHPAVIALHDADLFAGEVAIVMELVDGGDLVAWFATKPAWREVVARCAAAGAGLIAAHDAGLIHRDFKPHNVLCARDGRVLVADFGLARTSPGVVDATSALSVERAIVGTPAYMAPEQLLGDPVGPAADQFAFAATLYEGLFGARPFAGTTMAALIAEILAGNVRPPDTDVVPARVVAVVRRGLASAPAERWPSMRAMLDALAAAATEPPRRRWRVLALAASTLAVAAIAATIGLASRSPPVRAPVGDAGSAVASAGDAGSAVAPAHVDDAAAVVADAGDAGSRVAHVDDAANPVARVVDAATPVARAPDAARPSFAVEHADHFPFTTERAPFDAAARAWAADARLESMRATGVRADGSVDLATSTVTYTYVSPARAASDDAALADHCAYQLRVAHDTVVVTMLTGPCEDTAGLRAPRCAIDRLWQVVQRVGADPTKPADIGYLGNGSWEFIQGATREAIGDDCPR